MIAAVVLALLATASTAAPATFNVVALLPSGALTVGQRAALAAEVTRIWEPYGVQVSCPTGDNVVAGADMVVVVRVVDRIDAAGLKGFALGAVARLDGRMGRTVHLSLPSVEVMVRVIAPRSGPWFDRFLGRLAGRVLAHELGHLLLDSAAHSAEGLMRARFLRGDAVTSDSEVYRLTDTERARLDSRVAPATLAKAALARSAEKRDGVWRGDGRQ